MRSEIRTIRLMGTLVLMLASASQGVSAQPFVPPGTLYDNGVANGEYAVTSQQSEHEYFTIRVADDFILPTACPTGYYEVTRVRAQVSQYSGAWQPFAIDFLHDDGGGYSPAPYNGVVPFATYVEGSRTLLGTLEGDDLYEISVPTPELYVPEDTILWLSAFGTDAAANTSAFNFFATSNGSPGTFANGVFIAPGFYDYWTDISAVLPGSQALSFALDGACLVDAPRTRLLEGDEFQVNSTTVDSQEAPSIAVNADGGSVVVWQSEVAGGPSRQIHAQRYAVGGMPAGSELEISPSEFNHWWPDVAADTAGRFVVVWQANGLPGDATWNIHGRLYAADGTPLASEFVVNGYTSNHQYTPAVARRDSGEFVVVWASQGSVGDDVSQTSIQGQRFFADGSLDGSQFQINSYTPGSQTNPAVAIGPQGFVVTWESDEYPGDYDGSIQARRFDAAGNPLGDEFLVNSYVDYGQTSPDISLSPDGGFLIVWVSDGSSTGDNSERSILGQRFAADGAPLGAEFGVNSSFEGDQIHPSVQFAADGGSVVTWASDGSPWDTSGYSVQGRRFDRGGAALGPEFLVNTFTSSFQWRPDLGMAPSGDFVVAWDSWGSNGNDHDEASIQAQRFRVSIFGDGFESGDTLGWSSTEN